MTVEVLQGRFEDAEVHDQNSHLIMVSLHMLGLK